MHTRELYLSHDIHYQHASNAVAVIIRVIYKITRSSNKLKMHNGTIHCHNVCLKLLTQSLNISFLAKTSSKVIEYQLINYLANKLIFNNYVRSLRHTL